MEKKNDDSNWNPRRSGIQVFYRLTGAGQWKHICLQLCCWNLLLKYISDRPRRSIKITKRKPDHTFSLQRFLNLISGYIYTTNIYRFPLTLSAGNRQTSLGENVRLSTCDIIGLYIPPPVKAPRRALRWTSGRLYPKLTLPTGSRALLKITCFPTQSTRGCQMIGGCSQFPGNNPVCQWPYPFAGVGILQKWL